MARDYPLLLSDFKDTYDPALSYLPGSIVELSGSTFRTPVSVPAGTSPPAAPWRLLAGRGPKGDPSTVAGPPGPGYTSRGPHVIGTNYSVNDIVTYGGETFRRTVSGVSNTVPVDGQGWERWAQKGDVPSSRQVIAGPGLTGGGDLSNNRTLASKVSHFARVDRVGAQALSLVYGTETVVDFTRESSDTENLFSGTRYTCPTAGVYSVYAIYAVSGCAANDTVWMRVYRNGNPNLGGFVGSFPVPGSAAIYVGGTAFFAANAGDYLEMFVNVRGSGGAPQVGAGVNSLLTIGYWGAT